MSKQDIAPQGAPMPAATEVPIDTSPVSSPQPIGSQAPEKPQALNERQQSIQRAFDRAEARAKDPQKQARPAPRAEPPKAAEAKSGHNEPPEETEKFDLKKRPVSDQPRDRGRFARREQTDNDSTNAAFRPPGTDEQQPPQPRAGSQPGQPAPYRTLPEGSPYRDPPARMAEHAKRDWHATPETVRGEIGRMHQEFSAAYNQYRGDHEVMNSIRPFHQMAQQHGTTLQRAMSNYVSMEQKLRGDLIGGLDNIVSNLGLVDPQTGQQIGLRDIAYYILNMSQDQHKLTQAQNAQVATTHQIGQLHQMVNSLAQNQQRMQFIEQFNQTKGSVDQYAETHPRLDELADLIKQEIDLGFPLDAAYRRADLLRPPQAAQTRNPTAQTRPTDKSISGAPDVAPSNGASRRSDKKVGRREAIAKAIRQVNGQL